MDQLPEILIRRQQQGMAFLSEPQYVIVIDPWFQFGNVEYIMAVRAQQGHDLLIDVFIRRQNCHSRARKKNQNARSLRSRIGARVNHIGMQRLCGKRKRGLNRLGREARVGRQ